MLNTLNRCREYINGDSSRVAKFLPQFDGPYIMLEAHPTFSTYKLTMPNNPKRFPVFHVMELKHFIPNDPNLFPSRQATCPGPIVSELSEEEWKIEEIIDECRHGRRTQYLVKWSCYSDEENLWLPHRCRVSQLATLRS
jgi:hypothetical protein